MAMSRMEKARAFGRNEEFIKTPALAAAIKTPALAAIKTPLLQLAAKDISKSEVGVGGKRKVMIEESEKIEISRKQPTAMAPKLCHNLNTDFPKNAMIRGKRYEILIQEKSNCTTFSRASPEPTFLFFLTVDGALVTGQLEVSVQADRILLANFFFDVDDRDAEIALRMIFLFLTLENPRQTIFETNVFGHRDRPVDCDATKMKRFFRKINFFQAVERSVQHFAPTYASALQDFELFCEQ